MRNQEKLLYRPLGWHCNWHGTETSIRYLGQGYPGYSDTYGTSIDSDLGSFFYCQHIISPFTQFQTDLQYNQGEVSQNISYFIDILENPKLFHFLFDSQFKFIC